MDILAIIFIGVVLAFLLGMLIAGLTELIDDN